jgi:hypothetical protein
MTSVAPVHADKYSVSTAPRACAKVRRWRVVFDAQGARRAAWRSMGAVGKPSFSAIDADRTRSR